MFFSLAWKNVWRNKRRSSITVAAITVGMAGIIVCIAMMNGWLVNMIDNSVQLETGSIQVHKKGYQEDPSVDKLIPNPAPLIEKISKTKDIKAVSARIKAFGLISAKDNSAGAMLCGIDPSKEQQVTNLHQTMVTGTYDSIKTYNTIIIGKILADNLEVKTGDQLIILTQGADGSMGNDIFTISAIFSSASPDIDRSFIYMSLESAQDLLSTYGGVNELAISINNVEGADSVKQKISKIIDTKTLEVLTWKEILPGVAQMVTFFVGAIYLFYFIVFGIAAFGISNTLIMSIFERIHEIGVMLAVGTKPKQIFYITVIESVIIGTIGSIVGSIAGFFLSLYFIIFGLNLTFFSQIKTVVAMSPIIYFKLTFFDFVQGIIFVMIVTVLASLYPAFKASRLKPANAVRQI